MNENLLFTAKPVIHLINISQDNFLQKKNRWLPKIKDWVEKNLPGKIIPFSVDYE